MSSQLAPVANRYVDALFSLAGEQNQHDTVQKDMLILREVFAQSEMLQRFIVNPLIDRAQAEQAILALMDAVKAGELTRKFFVLLAHERRLEIAPLAIRKYLELLAESRNELGVAVTSAKALTPSQVAALTASLSQATGKKVTLNTQEDPALIGGVHIRVGSKLLDHSVAGRLQRMRVALTQAA